jgi:hypothetical protein
MLPGAMLIGVSSAHARRGLLWRKYSENYGKPGPVLVDRAPTWVMNPTLSRTSDTVAGAYRDDPAWASAEYGSEFRQDISALLTREKVDRCITPGVSERAPVRKHRYAAFIDPAGGSGGDSFTLAIAHSEGDTAILDAVREAKPPFSPEATVAEFSQLMTSYRVTRAYSDRWGGDWVVEAFKRIGNIHIEHSDKIKSALYLDLLPMINSRAVDLLDDQ